MNLLKTTLSILALSGLALSCGSKQKASESMNSMTSVPSDTSVDTSAVEAAVDSAADSAGAEAQVAKGAGIWADACSMCHGDDAMGKGKAGPMHGEGSLGGRYANAAELMSYVSSDMPKDDPGSLSSDDAAAVIAWILSKRGVELSGPVSADTAATLSI